MVMYPGHGRHPPSRRRSRRIPRTRRIHLRSLPTGKLEEVIFQSGLIERDLGVPDVSPCERGQKLGDMPLVDLDHLPRHHQPELARPRCGRLTEQVIKAAFHS